MDQLNKNLIYIILPYLDYHSIIKFGSTCKKFKSLVKDIIYKVKKDDDEIPYNTIILYYTKFYNIKLTEKIKIIVMRYDINNYKDSVLKKYFLNANVDQIIFKVYNDVNINQRYIPDLEDEKYYLKPFGFDEIFYNIKMIIPSLKLLTY